MKAKRLIALALAAVFMLSAAATPVFAAAALPQENAALEQQNDMVSIRLKATGDLVYGSNSKLRCRPTLPIPSISVLWWVLAAKRMAM